MLFYVGVGVGMSVCVCLKIPRGAVDHFYTNFCIMAFFLVRRKSSWSYRLFTIFCMLVCVFVVWRPCGAVDSYINLCMMFLFLSQALCG